MVNTVMIHDNTLQDRVLRILVTLLSVVVMMGCAEDNGGSGSDVTGMVALSWSFECPEEGKYAFIAQVYDSSNTYLTYGGPWECISGKGVIEDVSAGNGRTVVLLVENENGEFVYRGQKIDIDVTENMIEDIGEVTIYPFATGLIQPENNTSVKSEFSIEWEYVVGAARYTVMISDNIDFLDPIQYILPGPPYQPEDLQRGIRYYWKVVCLDIFENQSAGSETRHFTIALPRASILSPIDGKSFSKLNEITFAGKGFDDEEGPLVESALEWSSSIDGVFGHGESFESSGLSEGTHIITLTAMNSMDYSGNDSITIYIQPEE